MNYIQAQVVTQTQLITPRYRRKQHIMIAGATHVVVNAPVGGLLEDLDRSFELMTRNLKIQNNLFEVCAEAGVQKVLLQGSTCSYPEEGPQPFHELQLMEGKPYDGYLTTALPKLVGMYQCRASNDKRGTSWRTAICTNMFGPVIVWENTHMLLAHAKALTATREDPQRLKYGIVTKQTYCTSKMQYVLMDIHANNDRYDTVNVVPGVEITNT